MATKVIMPKMGYDMESGKIVRWLKAEGEPVHQGDDIAEIETEKVTIAIQAYGDGVLLKRLVAEGDSAPVGEMIAVVGQPGEKVDLEALRQQEAEGGEAAEGTLGGGEGREAVPEAAAAGAAIATPSGTPAAPGAEGPGHAAAAPPEAERLKVSPLASRLAAEKGVDLRQVKGSGPGGRITRDDVLKFAEQPAAPERPAAPKAPAKAAPPAEVIIPAQLSPMRQAIARLMGQSKREAPHFYATMAVDMTEAMRLRAMLNGMADEASQISVNDLVLKATALALQAQPDFNAHVLESGIVKKEAVNIGIAIAMPEGLVAPALMNCQDKGLAQIARGSKDLIARAKSGELRPEEMTEGTFTTTNLGMFGVESFSAIIVPPQVAILAVGGVAPTPVVREDQVVIIQQMKITLSADHRAVDGAQAARFLQEVKKHLESPVGLLL